MVQIPEFIAFAFAFLFIIFSLRWLLKTFFLTFLNWLLNTSFGIEIKQWKYNRKYKWRYSSTGKAVPWYSNLRSRF